MIDKGVVIVLFDNGWSQTEIGRRFGVSRARVCQIVGNDKRYRNDAKKGKLLCEVCKGVIKKKQYAKVEGTKPFLVCEKCKEKL